MLIVNGEFFNQENCRRISVWNHSRFATVFVQRCEMVCGGPIR